MHFKSDSYRIQTYNLLIRSQMLYSVELGDQFVGDPLRLYLYKDYACSSLTMASFFSLILAFLPES